MMLQHQGLQYFASVILSLLMVRPDCKDIVLQRRNVCEQMTPAMCYTVVSNASGVCYMYHIALPNLCHIALPQWTQLAMSVIEFKGRYHTYL